MTVDVVIAGAGPNGLMLACELSLAGVRPVVLERLPEPTGENRANGLVGQVVRMFDRRGLYARITGSSDPPQPQPGFVFGALPLDLHTLDHNPLYTLPVPQRRIEQILAERAVELGVEIRRGHELTGLWQRSDGVTIEVTGPDGPYRVSARYLVGADGGHSVTRKLAAIGFPGVIRDDVVSRTAHVTVPDELIDQTTGGLNVPGYGPVPAFMHHRTEHGLFVFASLPGKQPLVSTIEWGANQQEPQSPLTLDELRASVRRVLGADLPLRPPVGPGPHLLRRTAGVSTRLADRFRAGRVLLVGDAAHVHSAVGGPGLNLGLQDAVNLGWKLAAEINGWAPEGLLDSYETERRPVAQRVTMYTQAQSALIAPGAEVTALRQLCTELLRDEANVQHIADMMAGADIRYQMHGHGAHPLVGRWAPDLPLTTDNATVRLAELTADGTPLLLDLTADGALADHLSGWRDRVRVLSARTNAPDAPAALLLRPDCYIAWATASTLPGEEECAALRAALASWFGASGPGEGLADAGIVGAACHADPQPATRPLE